MVIISINFTIYPEVHYLLHTFIIKFKHVSMVLCNANFIISVFNPCKKIAQCSHMCLLSAVSLFGYTCVCPEFYSPNENSTDCIGIYGNVIYCLNSILFWRVGKELCSGLMTPAIGS